MLTINFNSTRETICLLESLKIQADKDFNLEVLDNASNQENQIILKDYLKKEWPTAIYIEKKENLGFAGGTNIQISDAINRGADWILLINNDTRIKENFINKLKEQLKDKSPAVVGLPIVEEAGPAYGGIIKWLRPPSLRQHMYSHQNRADLYVIGGGMLIHKAMLKETGGFDEKYFLYFEDADFSIRARKTGFSVYYLKEPMIFHQGSASTLKLGKAKLFRYHYRNILRLNSKISPAYVKFLVWPWSLYLAIKQIIKIFLGRRREDSKAILKGILDFYCGRMGKIDD